MMEHAGKERLSMESPACVPKPAASAEKYAAGVHVCEYSEADLNALAEAHLAAYKGYMNAGIGARYVRELLRWFMDRDDTIALKAVVDGRPAGYAVGLPEGKHRDLNRSLLSAYVVGAVTHPWILLHSDYRRSAWRKIKRILRPHWSTEPQYRNRGQGMDLTSIAVSPSASGRGAGTALLRVFEARAEEMGCDFLQLSVYERNKRAREIYEHAGWSIVDSNQIHVTYKKFITA